MLTMSDETSCGVSERKILLQTYSFLPIGDVEYRLQMHER